MSPRWSIVLFAAATVFAAEYKASDDGRVVYFTGSPAGDLSPKRLWRWTKGAIETVLEAPQIHLLRLSPEGRFALIKTHSFSGHEFVTTWQILLDGAPRPLVAIDDAQLVSMTPNGRWVSIYRNEPNRAVEHFELSAAGLRATTVQPNLTTIPHNLPDAKILATDPAGRQAYLRQGNQDLLYDAGTNTTNPLPPNPTLNSTLTAILTRPTAVQFTWQPLGSPAPEPLDRFDTLPLLSATSPTGLFATSKPPDFTIEWDGKLLSWVVGPLGYHYAFFPPDSKPGGVVPLRITSSSRPWLNVNFKSRLTPTAPALVPINAEDPRLLFIHQDFSGLVTPERPARPGEQIHLYVTGFHATTLDLSAKNATAGIEPASQAPGIRLRPVSLQPTGFSRFLQLLTLEVPRNHAFHSKPNETQALHFYLGLNKKAGDALHASGPVWFSISPN